MLEVCDSCLDCVYEHYGEDDVELEMAVTLCVDMGKDIEDHLCDKRESNGDVECNCACIS